MPEAAMNENHGLVLRKDKIGCAGQALVGDHIAKPHSMKRFAERDLRLRVRAPHALHERGSAFG